MKKKVTQDTRKQDAFGMNTIGGLVQGEWGHGWQPFDSTNDNGVDGIIIKRKRGIDTGNIIYAQVKCGAEGGYLKNTENRKGYLSILLGQEYIDSHRARWNRLHGAVIILFVHYKSGKVWWADLKSNDSYSKENKSIVLIPKSQVFGQHSIGEFKKINGYLFPSSFAANLSLALQDVNYLSLTKSLKAGAKEFYKKWSSSNERTNPELGEIIVSREGWRHLTSSRKRVRRVMNSLQLIGAAKEIIQNVGKAYQLRQGNVQQRPDGTYAVLDYISLRAFISFPYRQAAIVQVVLRRYRHFQSNGTIESRIWFHSVFEPLRVYNH
jgi:hypothetical protein